MKNILLPAMLLLSASLYAQKDFTVRLWPDGAPLSNGLTGPEEGWDCLWVRNISDPDMRVFLPEKSNGMAVLVCPGGGYEFLAMNHEGLDMVPWFNEQGITMILLKYRMPNGHSEIPLSDAAQAMRLTRMNADSWGIDPSRVGVWGASAGGHLASTLATHFDPQTRPDFQILLYPVISMEEEITHMGSRVNLLGKDADSDQISEYSSDKQVTPQTPPAFIVLSGDDKAVHPLNSVGYYQALLENKIPAEMHIYPVGDHGWGFKDSFPYKPQWTNDLAVWLQNLN